MPLTTYDLPTLQAQIMANFRAQFASANPPKDLSPTGYFGQLANVLAMTLLEAQNALLQVDQDWPPCGATYTPGRQSSTAALDQAAFLLGLPNGQGGFGRLLPTISSGGAGLLFAPAGTTYNDGLILIYEPTQVQVELDGAVTIPPMASSATGLFISITTGAAANLPKDAVLSFQAPPAGAQATVTLASALTGGADPETDGALLTRIFDRLQNPPTGGKSADWKDWLVSVPAVKQVYVFPRRSGTGTVDVVIATDSPGDPGRIPGTQTRADALAALNANRPVCSQPNVLVPYFPAGRAIYVWSLAYPTLDKYAWDWVSGSMQAGHPITGFSNVGTPKLIQIAGDIKATLPTLAARLDAGINARVIIAATGGPEVCIQVALSGYQVVTGPHTNFALVEPLPVGWVDPTIGDLIFPGGPIAINQLDPAVGPIQKSAAERVFEYIGQLGPSRQSGYADPGYYWDDTARIDAIKDVIINTVDLDGVQMVRSTGDETALPPVTTIQIGTAGTPTAQNFQALDATPGQPPEVIRAFRIVVTGP
jgi:hypothetical protein